MDSNRDQSHRVGRRGVVLELEVSRRLSIALIIIYHSIVSARWFERRRKKHHSTSTAE